MSKILSIAAIVLIFTPVGLLFFRGGDIPNDYTSDHYDGTRFFNAEPGHTFADTLRWMREMETVPWPKWVEDTPQPPPPDRVGSGELRITYINHATTLIQTDGVNILTDPIWSLRAGPLPFLGVRRVRAPGVDFSALPPIDVILISHDHYDHLDISTLKMLVDRDDPLIITGLGVGGLPVSRSSREVIRLDWWESHTPKDVDVSITLVPARHGSGRIPLRENRTLWGGFVIDTPGGRVYFAGDTGYGDFIDDIADRFDNIRLAVLPIGGYEKRWFMKSQHMNPDDAVRAHLRLSADMSVGMHYGTFAEHPEQAIDAHESDLAAALEKYGVNESAFRILAFGEGVYVP